MIITAITRPVIGTIIGRRRQRHIINIHIAIL